MLSLREERISRKRGFFVSRHGPRFARGEDRQLSRVFADRRRAASRCPAASPEACRNAGQAGDLLFPSSWSCQSTPPSLENVPVSVTSAVPVGQIQRISGPTPLRRTLGKLGETRQSGLLSGPASWGDLDGLSFPHVLRIRNHLIAVRQPAKHLHPRAIVDTQLDFSPAGMPF